MFEKQVFGKSITSGRRLLQEEIELSSLNLADFLSRSNLSNERGEKGLLLALIVNFEEDKFSKTVFPFSDTARFCLGKNCSISRLRP
ncbi:hypothetical protein SDJN02_08010, partial [Cucurbita argyrosperma subsp. argyrosperma]